MKQKFGTTSLLIAAVSFPLANFAGKITELYLKRTNPNNIDIALRSAYKTPITTATLVVFASLIVVALILALLGLKKDENKRLAVKSLLLSASIVIVVIATYALQQNITTTERSYSKKSINTFLQKLAR